MSQKALEMLREASSLVYASDAREATALGSHITSASGGDGGSETSSAFLTQSALSVH